MLDRVVAFLVVPLALTVVQAHARSDSLPIGLAAVTTAQGYLQTLGRSLGARPEKGAKVAQRRRVNPDEQAGPRYDESPPASTARKARIEREGARKRVIVRHDSGLHRGWRHSRHYGTNKTKLVVKRGDSRTVIKRKIEN
jgi:hypothetical protein